MRDLVSIIESQILGKPFHSKEEIKIKYPHYLLEFLTINIELHTPAVKKTVGWSIFSLLVF